MCLVCVNSTVMYVMIDVKEIVNIITAGVQWGTMVQRPKVNVFDCVVSMV